MNETHNIPGQDTQSEIVDSLNRLLQKTGVHKVYFADSSIAPPPLAYTTSFPRLAVPFSGKYPVEIAQRGCVKHVTLEVGDAVFVAKHCWDRPSWTTPVKVLTILFGKRQIGFSLVTQDGTTDLPSKALKTSVPAHFSDLSNEILDSLSKMADPKLMHSISHLLVGALLHTCAHILNMPDIALPRKANHTYDAICLFVQEHYQQPITRDTVADHFGLHPCHISRLFREEGHMRFTDYVTLVRIERAKFLLKNYDMPLKEVATNCGFGDNAYFCRVFRTITKVTPTAYRLRGL